MQLCKHKSGPVAQTQIESLPDITVQLLLVQLKGQCTEAGLRSQKYLYANAIFKCYICKNPNWHQNGSETQDQEESANML